MKSERDATKVKVGILERRIDDLTRAIGSQATILESLRASHEISIRRIADSFNVNGSPDTLAAVLASMEPERPE